MSQVRQKAARPTPAAPDTQHPTPNTQHPPPHGLQWNGFTIHSEVLLVTPDIAARWLEESEYEHQRKLREWHANELAYALKKDQFTPGSIEFYVLGDRPYLVNGQHRLRAIVKSGIGAPLVVVRIHVQSMQEIAAAYYRTDCGLSRGLQEAFPISGIVERTGLAVAHIKIVERATRFLRTGMQDRKTSGRRRVERNRDLRLQAVEEWAPQARTYLECVEGGAEPIAKRLSDAPVVAVALITLKWQEEKATGFWKRVAANDGLKRGMPEHTCFGVLATQVERDRPQNLYARLVAACWNAAFDQRDLATAVCRDEKRAILIKGTPYDGNEVIRYDWERDLEE